MKRHALVVVAFAIGLPGTMAAQAHLQQPIFKVAVDLVTVDVLVMAKGRPVAGLTTPNFEVYDNGVRQNLEGVGEGALQPGGTIKAQAVPLDVIFVLDTSESMAGDLIRSLAQAARGVLERLRPVDRAALITFSDRTVRQVALTQDLGLVGNTLEQMVAAGRTSMFDALYAALVLERAEARRCLIVIFTDGGDNASWLRAKEVLQVARESDVVIYGVGLQAGAGDALAPFVEATGGDLIAAKSANQLKQLFVQVIGEMQARYVLTYYLKAARREGWHTIEVKLARAKGDVRARRGYWVPRGR